VSKLKNPHLKKKVSLERDHRPAGKAHDKAIRKQRPAAKARTQRQYRRRVHGELHVDGAPTTAIDLEALDEGVGAVRREPVPKAPDLPLLAFIEQQKAKRQGVKARKPAPARKPARKR
jgi:hypothetical protein